MSRRRRLVAALASSLAAGALPTLGQPRGGPIVIGYLRFSATNPRNSIALAAGMRDLGYVEGRHFVIEERNAAGSASRLATLAAELVAMNPAVLVAGTNQDVLALLRATRTVPIVMAVGADPVGAGIIASLARPGGTVTGMSSSAGPGIYGKRLELLKEIVPDLRRVAVLRAVQEVPPALMVELARAAAAIDVSLSIVDIRSVADYDAALAQIRAARPDGLFLAGQALISVANQRICEFARINRLPATHALRQFALGGLLFTYGVDEVANYRRAGSFIDKILRGANPGDLPVEQPIRYEMVINLKTAREIGVRIPQSVLLRADEVIE